VGFANYVKQYFFRKSRMELALIVHHLPLAELEDIKEKMEIVLDEHLRKKISHNYKLATAQEVNDFLTILHQKATEFPVWQLLLDAWNEFENGGWVLWVKNIFSGNNENKIWYLINGKKVFKRFNNPFRTKWTPLIEKMEFDIEYKKLYNDSELIIPEY
jgi:hypothetical protein